MNKMSFNKKTKQKKKKKKKERQKERKKGGRGGREKNVHKRLVVFLKSVTTLLNKNFDRIRTIHILDLCTMAKKKPPAVKNPRKRIYISRASQVAPGMFP